MEVMQYFGLLGSFLACFGYLFYRIEHFESRFEEKMDKQDTRLDNLYQMFCDTQKETHQKFYDLLKEGKK